MVVPRTGFWDSLHQSFIASGISYVSRRNITKGQWVGKKDNSSSNSSFCNAHCTDHGLGGSEDNKGLFFSLLTFLFF